jgi:NAD(P)H-dependent flavin oxidoreductase YrpB (nitropropane dioxygenase family)
MKALKIGNLNVPLPIIQGGMGVGVSLSNLATAVANEGGIGVISLQSESECSTPKTEQVIRNQIKQRFVPKFVKHVKKQKVL